MMRTRLTRFTLGIVMLMQAFVYLPAKAQSNTGTIVGTVLDDSGAVIPGATVTSKDLGTGEQRTVTTDSSGSFSIPNLQVGHYSVSIRRDGFAPTEVADTELQVAQRATLNPVLHAGGSNDKITVIATAVPLLNEASSSVGQVIDTKVVQDMPLNGRNFWQLTQLTRSQLHPGRPEHCDGWHLHPGKCRQCECQRSFPLVDRLVSRRSQHY
jgi:hypothetical protein